MVDFYDRRQGKHQVYGVSGDPSMRQIDGIHEAMNSGKRVLVSHAGEYNTSPLGTIEGYLRQDPDLAIRAYHNARSTKGVEIHPEDVSVIEGARRDRKGRRASYLG